MESPVREPVTEPVPARQRWHSRRALARRPGLWSFGVYGLLSYLLYYPLFPGDPSRVPTCNCEDIVQTVWFLRYTPWALAHGKNLFATTLIEFPHGVDLAQNTGIWLLALLTAPLTLAVNAVASFNLLHWAAFTLSAYSAYWVLRRVVSYAPAAFVGGLLYGFSPYMLVQSVFHLDLVFVPFPPLILYGLYELLVVQRPPFWRWGVLTGCCVAAQFFISAEILATTALVAAIGVFILFFGCIREVPRRARYALFGLATAAAVVVPLIAYPVFMMRYGSNHYTGPAQGYDNVFNADLLGPLIPTHAQLIRPFGLSRIGQLFVGGNVQESDSYLGLPLLLGAIYLLVRYWRRLWMIFCALMASAAFVFSLGWHLVVDHRVIGSRFHLPFFKLEHVSLVANILPVRIALYVVFFVAVLVALGLDAYHDDVVARRTRPTARRHDPPVVIGRVVGALLALCAVLALLPRWPERTFKILPSTVVSSAELRVIPRNSLVLAYPFPTPFSINAMYWQQNDDMAFRLLGGYALVPGHRSASEFPHRLYPLDIEAIFAQSFLKIPTVILPDVVADQQTVNVSMAKQLRAFIVNNHVGAVVVEMGRTGSHEVAALVRLAFGAPTTTAWTAEIWVDPARRIRLGPPLSATV